MTIANTILGTMQSRLPKVIDARTHGVIDYCHAAFFLGLAWFYRKSQPRAALAAGVTGAFVLTQALLTDYPLGVAKVISFETHGRIDSTFAGVSFMIPQVFGAEGTAAAKVFKGDAFVAAAVVGMTDWQQGQVEASSIAS